jgi:hypothetical protein
MNRKPRKPAPYTEARKAYRPPQLVVFGKIHTIVTGGSGDKVDGRAMIALMRRP